MARALRPLGDDGSRRAFVETLRAVIDAHGQRVSARDRLYLLGEMPTLIVWGERDRTIPVEHGREAAGDDPQLPLRDPPPRRPLPQPRRPRPGLAAVLGDWLDGTEPFRIDDASWGEIIGSRREPA